LFKSFPDPVLLLFAVSGICALTAAPAHAQGRNAIPPLVMCGQGVSVNDAACQKEVTDWQDREKAWRENRRVYANYVTYKGRPVPYVWRADPPWWVAPYCAQDPENRQTAICQAYDDYVRYDWTQHIEGPQSAITFSKSVARGNNVDDKGFVDFLLRNLHYDGPWTTGTKGQRVYGLFGTHLTLAQAGRIHLWGPPGMLVVRRPGGKIDVRMTWGVDVFLGDIPLPFAQRKLPLYMSFAKVFGSREKTAIQHGINAGLNMLGFSVTIKR
jgi:hypothetical protein